MNLNKLSSYQNSEGKMDDGLVPRTEMRLPMIKGEWFRGKTVLDLGCNNGYFSRFAMKNGAKRVVGVDKSDCIESARELAKQENLKVEFWQVDIESKEFMRFCPKFDVVLLLSSLAKIKDKDKFLDWLDDKVKERLVFESNHGEVHKQDIDLVRKHIYFKYVDYLGPSEIPEKPHYLWNCEKVVHERRYGEIAQAPLEFVSVDNIFSPDEKQILHQKTKYSIESEEFKKLKEDIRIRGIRESLILIQERPTEKPNEYILFQGGHRFIAIKQLGYKNIPCRVLRGVYYNHLKLGDSEWNNKKNRKYEKS